jgi:energy-coupling factor transporter ATP-binding protein EcfA2
MTILSFRAKSYGCLRDVEVKLGTRLHAFVGPNDSGKSTLLRGIRTVLQFAHDRFEQATNGDWKPFNPFPLGTPRPGPGTQSNATTLLRCDVVDGAYEIDDDDQQPTGQKMFHGTPPKSWSSARKWTDYAFEPDHYDPRDGDPLGNQLRGARLCHFDASALRTPSGLLPQNEIAGFFDERGFGLPGIYQAILGRGDEAFSQIRESVRRLFPTVKRIAVVPVTRSEVSLEIELADGTRVRAPEISAGLLYYLAFAAIPHLDPVSALLLEEPENGLHPARIAEVIRLLRDFAERTDTQVFFATHSPLVLNELAPDEISVVTRPSLETGTLVTPLRATPNFEQRAKVYALGELWLAYCDGETEAPLLDASVK